MTKRKRAGAVDSHGAKKPKRGKQNATELSDATELSLPEKHFILHDAMPPPKSPILSDQPLTIPMEKKAPCLPDCEGAKLEPFARGNVQVYFIRELGGNAVHSNVFEVTINNKPYALKLFRTYNSSYYPTPDDWGDEDTYPASTDLAKYFKPFNRECRAYARMKQRKLNQVVWPCYGYLRLPGTLRDRLKHVTGLCDFYWQTRTPHSCATKYQPSQTLEQELRWPIYGLVKGLAPRNAPAIDPKARSIQTMLHDLKKLHKAGIVNDDLANRNYMSGRIVDFSSSYTLPHIWFRRPQFECTPFWVASFEQGKGRDFNEFMDLIRRSGIKTKVVAELRSGQHIEGRTRSERRWIFEHMHYWTSLYELGVREVSPSRGDSILDD